MLAMVLAGVPGEARPRRSFQALVFRPDPAVFTLRAEVVDRGGLPHRRRASRRRTKLRVKADLGPVKNVDVREPDPDPLLLVHAREPPEFVAFEGALGNGLEVVMMPETPATTTARLRVVTLAR